MLKPRPYAPYCSGVIQRASKKPRMKFEPAMRPYSRMAGPPLVPQLNIFCILARLGSRDERVPTSSGGGKTAVLFCKSCGNDFSLRSTQQSRSASDNFGSESPDSGLNATGGMLSARLLRYLRFQFALGIFILRLIQAEAHALGQVAYLRFFEDAAVVAFNFVYFDAPRDPFRPVIGRIVHRAESFFRSAKPGCGAEVDLGPVTFFGYIKYFAHRLQRRRQEQRLKPALDAFANALGALHEIGELLMTRQRQQSAQQKLIRLWLAGISIKQSEQSYLLSIGLQLT